MLLAWFRMRTNPSYLPSRIVTTGFGLVELIVSISIMVLITTVILAKHDSFNGTSLLRGQAYRIALQTREVQLFAISATDLGNNSFRNVYGLHFNTATPGLYKVFRDSTNGNNFFDNGEEFGKQGILDKRFEVKAIRLVGGTGPAQTQVSVSFKRPNFDARIYTGANTEANSAVSGVEIDVAVKSTGAIRTIEITKTGQISVKDI